YYSLFLNGMRIGIIIQYYSFRKDLRDLVDFFAERHDVVLFVKSSDKENLRLSDKVLRNASVVEIASYRRSWKNRVWNFIYTCFGNRPKSRSNSLKWTLRRFGSSMRRISN